MKQQVEKVAVQGVFIGRMPVSGETCPLCKNKILHGRQDAVKFARVDAKTGDIGVWYTHYLCATEQNRLSKAESEQPSAVSDEKRLGFWARLEERKKEKAECPKPKSS